MNTNPPTDQLDPNEETAIDALLAEVHGSVAPDLSHEILSQLGAISSTNTSSDSGVRLAISPRKRSRSMQTWGTIAGVVAAIAACVMAIVWASQPAGDNEVDGQQTAAANPATKTQPGTKAVDLTPQESLAESDEASKLETMPTDGDWGSHEEKLDPKPIRRGVPMIVQQDLETIKPDALRLPVVSKATGSPDPIQTVAASVDQDLRDYWQAVGIKPAAEVTSAQVANRLANQLGLDISGMDPETLRRDLMTSDGSSQIANRWLTLVTSNGLSRMDEKNREALVGEVAKGIAGEQSFGKTLSQLIGGQNAQSKIFYGAMSRGGHETMVRRMASLAMNVDLRCTKCHDAMIEGKGRQESYWAFSSFMQRGVKKGRDGWKVLQASELSTKPMYYELSDGRQRFVQPAVAGEWMGAEQPPAEDLPSWSKQLVQSPAFARGIVNSLWQLVHGRPLTTRAIDTITAPSDEALDRLEQRLVDDLVQSNFDVGRTLALVITSPVTRLSVPEALRPKNALTSSDDEIRDALEHINSFAAAVPLKSDLSVKRRLEIAMKSAGGRIDDLDGSPSVLANIAPSLPPAAVSKQAAGQKKQFDDFPYKAAALPVQWLASIDSYQQRVDHLAYLAGYSELPQPFQQAASALEKSHASQELVLSRVWWLLQPR